MKKNIFHLITACLFSLTLFSCESALDKKNLENLTDEDLWVDPTLLKGFMDKVMADNLPDANRYYSISDEGYGQYDLELPYDMVNINGTLSFIEAWNYGGIRNINLFLDNIDKCPATKLTATNRNDYIAQMKVLRAYKYFQMVRLYGGVPIILHAQSPEDDLNVSRNKTSECIAQIIKDLDDAINTGDDFPMKRDDANAGRLNRAIALAIKGQVLLYYASPQFSKQTPAGTKDATTRWNEAYAANKTAVDQLSAAGYGLFRPDPASPEEALKNLRDMFSEEYEIGKNPEIIWARRYSYPARPATYNGNHFGNVTIEAANAFANADGTPYTEIAVPAAGAPGSSLSIENKPFWLNREPRFELSVNYNGKNYPMYLLNALTFDLDEKGRQKHWWIFSGGANAPFSNCERLDELGMKISKICDNEKINGVIPNGNTSGQDWPLFRYAELMLNLAECAAKTGKEAEARDLIYQIRKRAGIPKGSNNYGIGSPAGDELILAILKERQVELFCENSSRWHELRRWRAFTDPIAGFKMNGLVRHTLKPRPVQGIDLLNNADVLATIDMSKPETYFAVFNNEIHAIDANPFNVGERQYFYRISYEEHLKKNPNIRQTDGWEGGSFNPYE